MNRVCPQAIFIGSKSSGYVSPISERSHFSTCVWKWNFFNTSNLFLTTELPFLDTLFLTKRYVLLRFDCILLCDDVVSRKRSYKITNSLYIHEILEKNVTFCEKLCSFGEGKSGTVFRSTEFFYQTAKKGTFFKKLRIGGILRAGPGYKVTDKWTITIICLKWLPAVISTGDWGLEMSLLLMRK